MPMDVLSLMCSSPSSTRRSPCELTSWPPVRRESASILTYITMARYDVALTCCVHMHDALYTCMMHVYMHDALYTCMMHCIHAWCTIYACMMHCVYMHDALYTCMMQCIHAWCTVYSASCMHVCMHDALYIHAWCTVYMMHCMYTITLKPLTHSFPSN